MDKSALNKTQVILYILPVIVIAILSLGPVSYSLYLFLYMIFHAKPKSLMIIIILASLTSDLIFSLQPSKIYEKFEPVTDGSISRVLIENIFIVLLTYIIFSYRKKTITSKSILLLNQSLILLGILTLWGIKTFQPIWIINTLRLGYDNVSHLAILRALQTCDNFLTKCQSADSIIPENFIRYPQQWHILFSNLVPNIELNRTNYFTIVLISFIIAVKLLLESLHHYSKGVEKSLPKVNLATLSILISIAVSIALMGYHNFLFACSVIIWSQVVAGSKSGAFNSILHIMGLLIGTSMYTLFWPISTFLILQKILTLNFTEKGNRYASIFGVFATISVNGPILFNQIIYRHIEALKENSNGWIGMFPIIALISFMVFDAKMNWFRDQNIDFLRLIVIVAGLFHLVIFISGQVGSYFLYKYCLFVVMVAIICFNDKAFAELHNEKMQANSFYLALSPVLGSLRKIQINKIFKLAIALILINAFITKFVPFYFPGVLQVVKNLNNSNFVYLEKIIDEKGEDLASPIFVATSNFSYYSDSQYVASAIGLWPDRLQKELDRLAQKGEKDINKKLQNLLDKKGFDVIDIANYSNPSRK